MLFNSLEFVLLFLPITLFGAVFINQRTSKELTIAWLVACSLFFYSWWNPKYITLILASVLFNFLLGKYVHRLQSPFQKKSILTFGIITNLGLLGYFKYTNFLIENLNTLFGADIEIQNIILPLAISFFTFQQITYLVDSYKGLTSEYNFLHYCLFCLLFSSAHCRAYCSSQRDDAPICSQKIF